MKLIHDDWCRKCNHTHYWVVEKLPDLLIDKCAKPDCKCSKRDFAPKDNLEFLEYELDKRRSKNEI